MPASTASYLSRQQWHWLRTEVARWRDEGLITAGQAQAILARYPEPAASGQGRTIAVLTTLGAILLGLAAILFIAHNWWQIPAGLKLAGMAALTAVAHGAGLWLWRVRGTYPRTGHALIILGCLLYGAGIWVVAQAYHLRVHWPAGLLAWALGCLPVAWALGSRPALGLGALLLAAWNLAEQRWPGPAAWLYPLPVAALVAPPAYRLQAAESLWFSLAGLAVWVGARAAHLSAPAAGPAPVLLALGLYGTAAALAGLWHRGRDGGGRLAPPYLLGGLILLLACTYAMTGAGSLWHRPPGTAPTWQAFAFCGALGALAAGLAVPVARQGRGAVPGVPGWVPAAGLLAWAACLPAAFLPAGAVRMVLANLVLLAATAGLVAWGFREGPAAVANLGLAAFGVQAASRYFDLFYSLLDRALFFAVGGLLLLGGGFALERWRRRSVKGESRHGTH